jgi:hypothetical protein
MRITNSSIWNTEDAKKGFVVVQAKEGCQTGTVLESDLTNIEEITEGGEMKIEEKLKEFYGTEHYYSLGPIFKTKATDGVAFLMESGYSWFVTDSLAVIECDIKTQDFLVAKLAVKEGKAVMEISDGNGNVFHTQHYNFTDSDDGELKLFIENGVVMLPGER